MLRSQRRVYDGSGEVARTQDVWGAEGISGRVKFLPLAWAGMPKTSFRKNSDSPQQRVRERLPLKITRVEWKKMEYTKTEEVNAPLSPGEGEHRKYCCKPEEYAEEEEWRLFFLFTETFYPLNETMKIHVGSLTHLFEYRKHIKEQQ